MAIKFHCEHCGKSISAPDNAGGKKGRCPSCKEVVYVPAADVEELDLAPIDEDAERRRQRIVEESLRREHDLLLAQGRQEKSDNAPGDLNERNVEGGVVLPEIGQPGAAQHTAGDLRNMLVSYLAMMAGGQIEQADAIARQLKSDTRSARSAIEQFLSDPVPDARIAKLPPPVLGGFLKQLQQQLK